MKALDHTQWLLLDKLTGYYHSLITPTFGGRPIVDVAISLRKPHMDLVLIGSRDAGKQAVKMARNMYKVPEDEVYSYQIYSAYKPQVN